uniref:Uncharacterized protein n=1 Tax=Arundo donax TaxID=35708 RepID=A0A0A9DV07_ARUDO
MESWEKRSSEGMLSHGIQSISQSNEYKQCDTARRDIE